MTTIDTGGPAFPNDWRDNEIGSTGMTLRDYFAAKAMQGLLAQSLGTALGSDPKSAAIYAYAMADAMLKARNDRQANS